MYSYRIILSECFKVIDLNSATNSMAYMIIGLGTHESWALSPRVSDTRYHRSAVADTTSLRLRKAPQENWNLIPRPHAVSRHLEWYLIPRVWWLMPRPLDSDTTPTSG